MKFFIYICLFLLTGPQLLAGTLHVSRNDQSGKAYRTIKEAVGAAAAGDTILIHGNAIYVEQTITIDKPLFIKGIDWPVLDGERKHEILAIKSDDVVIEGLKLQKSGYSSYNDIAAVRIYNSRNVHIRNNILEETFFGIYSQHGTSCVISGNQLRSTAKDESNSANGIHCWKSDSMRIENNSVTGHRDGIYFEFVTNSLISGNISKKNVRYGLHFMFSHNDTYINNVFENNDAGVAVMYSRGVTMLNNLFSENWGSAAYGILLKDINDSRIEGNRFVNNTCGIFAEGSTRINISQNQFTGNGWAMKLQASCTDNAVFRNNFRNNTFDVATNGRLVLNSFTGNYWDKYEGYDLNRDGAGDVPYHPVSLYSMIAEKNPPTILLFRSFIVSLLDKTEKLIPGVTPVELRDTKPLMKPIQF